MAQHTHDLLVIGAGPAGYVAAIRAAQLGLDVGCVDKGQVAGKAALGGTCLRVGCIPSKALLQSSEKYEDALKHFADHGISVGDVKLDLQKMLSRKDQVVQTLTGGISGLFKKNKVKAYHGTASFNADKTVSVGDDVITAEHVLIATGSVPRDAAGRRLGPGPDRHLDGCPDLHGGAQEARGHWGRRDRAGAGQRLASAGQQGRGPGIPRPHPAGHGRTSWPRRPTRSSRNRA